MDRKYSGEYWERDRTEQLRHRPLNVEAPPARAILEKCAGDLEMATQRGAEIPARRSQ